MIKNAHIKWFDSLSGEELAMIYFRSQIIKDIIAYSSIDFDKENILSESDYLGETYQSLAQDIADDMAFKWNRMTRDDPRFSEFQDRIHQLIKWTKA